MTTQLSSPLQKQKLNNLKKTLNNLKIVMADDELYIAGIAIARFVCSKELRNCEFSDLKEKNNER